MLNRNYQPLTIDPNKLLIGISSIALNDTDLGSITNASLDITSTIKERYIGYPANRTHVETESVSAQITLTAEEIGYPPVHSLVEAILANIETQTAIGYYATMLAPFAMVGNLKLSASVKIYPEFVLNWQEDWANIQFKFECVGSNAQTLVTKTTVAGTRAPSTTVNTEYLAIGKPKVLITLPGNDPVSVGSVQSVKVALTGNVKKIETGYPRCVQQLIYVDSKFDVSIVTEEDSLPVVDSCIIAIQQALINGKAVELRFPTCKISEDLSFAPKSDWIGYAKKVYPYKSDTLTPICTYTII